jgi:hypothetical protein
MLRSGNFRRTIVTQLNADQSADQSEEAKNSNSKKLSTPTNRRNSPTTSLTPDAEGTVTTENCHKSHKMSEDIAQEQLSTADYFSPGKPSNAAKQKTLTDIPQMDPKIFESLDPHLAKLLTDINATLTSLSTSNDELKPRQLEKN